MVDATGSIIDRDPFTTNRATYNVVVIGGGIYGACLLLEAARRGLRCLLLERDDFGGATTWNSLRILHGGLRYLQSLDLHRFHDSVGECKWFCQNFPDLVRPLPCLMPLYGKGLKRPTVFRVALAINDWLSRRRNQEICDDLRLPHGRMLDIAKTIELFPLVDREGLQGSGLWYDAAMTNPQRILIEILRWACALGARASNYVEATGLLTDSGQVVGVRARDRVGGRTFKFHSQTVVNCAGPWSRQISKDFDRDIPNLFRPLLAFNVLLDRNPPSEAVLAVQPKRPQAQVYFMHPCRGRILAGSVYVAWTGGSGDPVPSQKQIDDFLDDLNVAVPGLDLTPRQIVRVYAGFLPTTGEGSVQLTTREIIYDHSRHGGPRGLFSLCGIKYTMARLVAEKTLRTILNADDEPRPAEYLHSTERPRRQLAIDPDDPEALLQGDDTTVAAEIRRMVQEEAVVTVDDLLLRRTNWGEDPRRLASLRYRIETLLDQHPSDTQDGSKCILFSPLTVLPTSG